MSNLKAVGISFCMSFAEEDSGRNFSDFNVSFRVIPDRGTPPHFFLNMYAEWLRIKKNTIRMIRSVANRIVQP